MIFHEKHMTADQFIKHVQQPKEADRLLELINGEIIEKVPTEEHGIIVGNILAPMRAFVKLNKLGRVATEVHHRLPSDDQNAVLPDVSFRSELSSPVVRKGAVPIMPDLAVEGQSPNQSDEFMAEKAAYYLANGSRMVWLVFTAKRIVEIRTQGQKETFTEADTLSGGDVLPGFTLPVREVFDLE